MKLSFQNIFSLFFIVNAIISITVIILERRRPEKTIAWLLIFVVFPPLGLFLYIFAGRNWKKHKLSDENSENTYNMVAEALYKIKDVKYPSLIKLILNNNNSPVFIDNDIEIFNNGEEKFKALKKCLRNAKHHIHMEYYIVKNDTIGNEIKNILIEKAKEGVEVRFIIDKVGSPTVKTSFIKDLKTAGVNVVFYTYFLAPLLRHINTQLNYRNHRKIVVIDGKIGFIGGINIGDEYLGKGPLGYWRDTHLMVKGDFVLGLQAVFLDDFYMTKRADNSFPWYDDFENYFPTPKNEKGKVMQLVKSGPDSDNAAIMQTILKMISLAEHHIYITTPYFIPPTSLIDTLKISALSGVDIRILFPGRYDHFTVYYASKTYLSELVKFGIKVYFYDSSFFVHSKLMTVDGEMSTVGTANMDIRSFELNYEINALIYDDKTTKALEDEFLRDLNISKRMYYEDFENIPFYKKYIEAVARVFSNLL
ncbi:cardiolipin synthase [Haloimpatiens sp. FM7315]|uniref:cardiolipin synthase n=1 Tax=Haloimpatiens sp. FM7315 TaxID=3298609 RepID=UPI00370C00F7